MAPRPDPALSQQLDYYCARASEYDEWFFRKGRYDRGEAATRQWFSELDQIEKALAQRAPLGDCLELACGTGLWTRHLINLSSTLNALDGSEEMLSLCRERLPDAAITYSQVDLFNWQSDRRYDFIFFAFWLSHIPPDQFDSFWMAVKAALHPGGRVFFVDSKYIESSTASDHCLPPEEEITLTRKLNDGREFQIYKVFHQTKALREKLSTLGFAVAIEKTEQYFIFGEATLA